MKKNTLAHRVSLLGILSLFVLSSSFVGKAALIETTAAVPKLGEDPKGALLFIVMGLCVAVMIGIVIFGKKKNSDDDGSQS